MSDHAISLRVCFIGDSFTNGTGDDTCLGWVGRVCAASRRQGCDLTCYNLGIRGDTSADIRLRWHREALVRLPPGHDSRLVFSFGTNDCCLNEDGSGVRVPHDQAVTNTQEILTRAHAWRPTLMVGPLPVGDRAADRRISELSQAFATLCGTRGVPYLEVFNLAANSSAWAREIMAGDGTHPNALGYTVVSEAVQQWADWQAWTAP